MHFAIDTEIGGNVTPAARGRTVCPDILALSYDGIDDIFKVTKRLCGLVIAKSVNSPPSWHSIIYFPVPSSQRRAVWHNVLLQIWGSHLFYSNYESFDQISLIKCDFHKKLNQFHSSLSHPVDYSVPSSSSPPTIITPYYWYYHSKIVPHYPLQSPNSNLPA